MMAAAPEMSPTLDEAIRAADYPLGTHDAQQLRPVLAFLNQLDEVRDVPALVLDRAQAEHMEGAYQAGVRCADESGHVLVMSLPVFLELCPPPVPARSDQVLDWLFARPVLLVALALWSCSAVALLVDHDDAPAAWLFVAGIVAALAWCVGQLPATRCTYACNSGRTCTCGPQPMKESK